MRLFRPLFALSLTVLIPAAHAQNIERSCSGGYRIHLSSIESVDSKTTVRTSVPIADVIGGVANPDGSIGFSARRGCGATVPNRCRRRASETLLACMEAHAAAPGTRPVQCVGNGIEGYSILALDRTISHAVCKYLDEHGYRVPKPYTIDTTIKGMIHGDDGCGGGDRQRLDRDLAALQVTCAWASPP